MGIVALLVVIAYYPFRWDPPRTVRNDVARSADGALRFGEMNDARTPGTLSWLHEAQTSGVVEIRLGANPKALRQQASIMMLASDFWHTDFAIAQDDSDLQVWVRRPGTNANGDPPFTIHGVLRPGQWASVEVAVDHAGLRISVAGRTRLAQRLPADTLRAWGPGRISLGDEVNGGRPWQGQIRQAEVRGPGYAADYARPGALAIPVRYLYAPDHIEPFPPAGVEQWLIVLLDMLSFVPAGFLIAWIRRPPMRALPAGLLAAALAVALAAGKFLFHSRHTSVAIVVMEAAGGVIGVWLASLFTRAARRPRMPGGT